MLPWRVAVGISVAALILTTALAEAKSVHVRAHTRSDGTYVPAHQRTVPNDTRNDNWTTLGNRNPYTGKEGTLPGGPANANSDRMSNGRAAYTALSGGDGFQPLRVRSYPCDGIRVGGIDDPENGFCVLN